MNEAFKLDAQFVKAFKFIKDPKDLAATLLVLKEHYGTLKCQFLTQISNPKYYPVVSWLDYSNACG